MHIPFLMSLFPKHNFILYDPQPFHEKVEQALLGASPTVSRLTIHRQLFGEEDMALYTERKVLMISDIRIVPDSYNEMRNDRNNETLDEMMVNSELEEYVKQDMDLQLRWHLTMAPTASMMKFRLPYEPGISTYLKGEIHYQAWAPSTSTECRLVTIGDDLCEYDHTDYESKMYRFNLCTRFQEFPLSIAVKDIAHGYDIATELHVFSEYFLNVQKKQPKEIPGYLRGIQVALNKYFEKSLKDKYDEAAAALAKRVENVKRNLFKGGRDKGAFSDRGRGNRGRGNRSRGNRSRNYDEGHEQNYSRNQGYDDQGYDVDGQYNEQYDQRTPQPNLPPIINRMTKFPKSE
jgi:hypothetical protein